MEIIKLNNISFRYSEKSNINTFFLENLDFTVSKGDFISILGPNGSGKSTLLKIIANILKPSIGERTLYNQTYSKIKRTDFAKNVAFVPQNSSTNFPYSVYEIVMMGRSPYLNFLGMEDEIDHKYVLDTLELLEISHLKQKGINEVSGGEAQRALIARAIVQKPKILLLDEPNTHLDIKHQLSIFNLLREFNTKNELTIITISHDLNFSNYFSNRAVLMKDGEILYDSSPEAILTEQNIKEVFDVDSKLIVTSNKNNSVISLIPEY
jgi:ABC-type cobalamin/Fe3+-siderophores transport system ATPase subunit